jgi:AraC-like DNA-binding protein
MTGPKVHRPLWGPPDEWLADGSPLYGQLGVVAVDVQAGTVQCAACGRWLGTVSGSHLVAAHGLSVHLYRERYGLGLRTVLEAPARRAQRSASTYQRIKKEPALAELLAAGAADARSGVLSQRNRVAVAAGSRRSADRLEIRRALQARARVGNQRMAEISRQRRVERAQAFGFPDVAGYVTHGYAAGWTMTAMAADLGCGVSTISRIVAELGLPGPLDPGHPIEQAALRRVGHLSMRSFLLAHPPGTSPLGLAKMLGHSVPWMLIRARRDGLHDRLVLPGTAEQRATVAAHDAGFCDLGQYLAHRYAKGGLSGGALQAETGMHSVRIAALLKAAGVQRRTDPDFLERQALDRIGWLGTLGGYAQARIAAGWTVQRMSQELGHSDVWLARRLRRHGLGHLIGPRGRRRSGGPTPPSAQTSGETTTG